MGGGGERNRRYKLSMPIYDMRALEGGRSDTYRVIARSKGRQKIQLFLHGHTFNT